MRVIFVIKRSDHKCSTPFDWEFVEVRQVSVLACIVLTGTSEGLMGLRVLKGARCKCYGTGLSCGIDDW